MPNEFETRKIYWIGYWDAKDGRERDPMGGHVYNEGYEDGLRERETK